MNLSPEDIQLFYKLWWSVLAYTNRQKKLVANIEVAEHVPKKPVQDLVKLRDAFYQDKNLLDQYLTKNPDSLSAEEHRLVASWKHRVVGDFYILRYLKKYAIFLSSNPSRIYGVLGLVSPIEEIVPEYALPQMVKTGLLPFRDLIVFDGLLSGYNVMFGGGIRADLNETYSRLKRKEGIVEGLTDQGGNPAIRTTLDKQKTAKPAQNLRPVVAEIAAQTSKLRGAETDVQNATLGLLRVAATLAQVALDTPPNTDEHFKQLKSVKRALTRVENLLYEDME